MVSKTKQWAAAALIAAVMGLGVRGFADETKTPAGASAGAAKASAAESAGEPNTLTDKEKADGWALLFDGKSADQWRNYKKETLSNKWKVADGALTLTGSGGGDIVTKEKFDAYELVLDYRIAKGGNSGLMFHVTEEEGTPWMTGPEIQIQDNVAGKDPQKAGWLYQLYPPANDPQTGKPIDATKPAGEWNTLRVVLNGPRGEIHMNGVRYTQFELWGDEWNQKVAKSKFGKMPKFGKAKSGHIALQDHGDEVSFRNIKIRKLDPAKASAEKPAADTAK